MRRRNRNPRCAVNVAVEVLGDSWSLLIVRDIVFYGKHTFREFLDGAERITTSVLSDRLAALVKEGILDKRRSPTDQRREEYSLTEKGLRLIPVLVELANWGTDHGPEVIPHPKWVEKATTDPAGLHALVRETAAADRAAFRGPDSVLDRLNTGASRTAHRNE